jgi:hypothetical protein
MVSRRKQHGHRKVIADLPVLAASVRRATENEIRRKTGGALPRCEVCLRGTTPSSHNCADQFFYLVEAFFQLSAVQFGATDAANTAASISKQAMDVAQAAAALHRALEGCASALERHITRGPLREAFPDIVDAVALDFSTYSPDDAETLDDDLVEAATAVQIRESFAVALIGLMGLPSEFPGPTPGGRPRKFRRDAVAQSVIPLLDRWLNAEHPGEFGVEEIAGIARTLLEGIGEAVPADKRRWENDCQRLLDRGRRPRTPAGRRPNTGAGNNPP